MKITDEFVVIKGKQYKITKDSVNYIEWDDKSRFQCSTRAWKRISQTITTKGGGYILLEMENKKYRIRKLMPIECFRLMGVRDDDYYKIAKNQSDSSLYHLAGDSIVVDVLSAIFKRML